jgi:hypothetical protein
MFMWLLLYVKIYKMLSNYKICNVSVMSTERLIFIFSYILIFLFYIALQTVKIVYATTKQNFQVLLTFYRLCFITQQRSWTF